MKTKFFQAKKIDGLYHCAFSLEDGSIRTVTDSDPDKFMKTVKDISLHAAILVSIARDITIPLRKIKTI